MVAFNKNNYFITMSDDQPVPPTPPVEPEKEE